ncbi:MAG: MBL fold metallo-hydrolase [Acidimicrobiia bacterium]
MCDDPSHHHGHEAARAVAHAAPRPITGEAVDPIPLQPVDRVTITVLIDNSYDALLGPGPHVRRGRSTASVAVPTYEGGVGTDQLQAEHGFAALVTVERDGVARRLLFDTGVSPLGMVENLRRLDLDLGDIEIVVCSHGHYDHTGGFDGLVRRLGRPNLPVLIHPQFWRQRRVSIAGRDPIELPSTSRRALEGVGFEIIERREPSFLLDGSVLITGEVDRTTDFELGFPGHEGWDHEAKAWRPDPLILDDQALVVSVAGRGLVVLTGCGHAGAVNIVRYAQRLTGSDRVSAVIGGFHLGGPAFEPIIEPTVRAFAELAPELVVPSHCTGWRATHRLAAALPDAFVQTAVGSSFLLEAPPADAAA